MNRLYDFLNSFLPWLSKGDFWIIIISIIVAILVMAFYVFNDAKMRGGNSIVWFVVTILLGGIIPFIFYLMVRSPVTLDELKEEETKKEVIELERKYYELMIAREVKKCPVCGEEVSPDFLYCPHCFTQLKKRCPNCGAVVEKDLKICPYCGFVFEERKE
ncbi:MAG: zinc ribbon domain-containing protein [Caldisericaceae bacterium]